MDHFYGEQDRSEKSPTSFFWPWNNLILNSDKAKTSERDKVLYFDT